MYILPTREYRDYLQSYEWHVLRARMLQSAFYKCSSCGYRGELEVHHKTYERLGSELDEDLEVLCSECHEKKHKHLSHDRGLETFMSKKYGKKWEEFIDLDRANFEFNCWIESKYEFGQKLVSQITDGKGI